MEDQSLQILMILKYLPPLFSGSGKQAVFLAKALAEEGAKVKMISMIYKQQLHLLNTNKEKAYHNIHIVRTIVPEREKLKYIPFNLKIKQRQWIEKLE